MRLLKKTGLKVSFQNIVENKKYYSVLNFWIGFIAKRCIVVYLLRFIHIHLVKNIDVRLGYVTWPKLGYACAIRIDIRWRARLLYRQLPAQLRIRRLGVSRPVIGFDAAQLKLLSFDNSVRVRVLKPKPNLACCCRLSLVGHFVSFNFHLSNIQNHLLI